MALPTSRCAAEKLSSRKRKPASEQHLPVRGISGRIENQTRARANNLQLRDRRLRDVLVLLRGAAAHAARALDHAVFDDRHGAHARDHVSALGGGDSLDDWAPGALLQLAAGAAERGRRDRLTLGAVDATPDGAVH